MGNHIEAAMLLLLKDMGCDYRLRRIGIDIVRVLHPTLKSGRTSTLIRTSGNTGILFTMAASEVIIWTSASFLDEDGSVQTLDEKTKQALMNDVTGLSSEGLTAVGIAYCDIDDVANTKDISNLPTQEMKMTLVATLGLQDPPRKVSGLRWFHSIATCDT